MTFSVSKKTGIMNDIKLFTKKEEGVDENLDPLGYRLYCEFSGQDDSKEVVDRECIQLAGRFPFIFRKLGLKFARKILKRLLIFRIKDVRPIGV